MLRDSARRTNGEEENIRAVLCRYQQLLEDSLEKQYRQYRPTYLLQQCMDYENWPAAAVVYRMLGDYAAELQCLILASRAASETPTRTATFLLQRHTQMVQGENAPAVHESSHMILLLLDFWQTSGLPLESLESHLLSLMDRLCDSLHQLLLLENAPPLPFSSPLLLALTNQCLEKFKSENPFSSNLVSEEDLWVQILRNFEKDTERQDHVLLSKESAALLRLSESDARKFKNQEEWNVSTIYHFLLLCLRKKTKSVLTSPRGII